jgi:tetratricopeptide (TPR) repeat protein
LRIGQHAVLSGAGAPRGEASLKRYLAYEPLDGEPSLATAWYWLGMLYERQGRTVEAGRSFKRALTMLPEEQIFIDASRRVDKALGELAMGQSPG